MKPATRYRLYMLGAIVVVLLNTSFAVHVLKSLFQAQDWVRHTTDVLATTDDVSLQMSLADRAVVAYLFTGEPQYGQEYQDRVRTMYAGVNRIQALTGDNPPQQARISVLRQRISAKVGALDTATAVHRGRHGVATAAEILRPAFADSPDRGVSVRYAINQIQNEEMRLLHDRQISVVKARREVIVTFGAATLLDLVLLVVTFQQLIGAREDQEHLATSAAEIATLNAELKSLNTDLEARVEERTRELELSNRELEAFSYSVSHDLRAPLRTIDGFSLALAEDFSECLNEEGRDFIRRVRGGVQRMGTLIDALLQLSRVTRSEVQRDRVDLSQLVTLVFHELMVNDPERRVAFSAKPGVMAEADPRLLRVAFENLLGNAIKFTSRAEEARIEFGETEKDGHTVYFIRDNGAGFDMQYVDRLFTAFQRLHGDRDFKGSGIGLATVSRIIRRHHGEIWAEGQTGQGATFFFTLSS